MCPDSLGDCIREGECESVLYKREGCPHCNQLKGKLDDLGIPYEERELDIETARELEMEHVPVLRVSSDKGDIDIGNDSIESLKRKFDEVDFDEEEISGDMF